jgi:hypothetical protein
MLMASTLLTKVGSNGTGTTEKSFLSTPPPWIGLVACWFGHSELTTTTTGLGLTRTYAGTMVKATNSLGLLLNFIYIPS